MFIALEKLKQLLNSRYGKSLEFRHLMDLSKLQGNSEPAIHGNDLYIPIVVEEQFLGTAIIPHGWELSLEVKNNVTQLVRMVLEPHLYTEFLARRETNLRSVEFGNFSATNLNQYTENYENEDQDISIGETQTLITSLLHLHGHDNSLIKKIALQIHEFSARWAFVHFEDVCKDLDTAMDICSLGAMTLFIENIEALTPKHQDLLAEYLKSPRSLSEPLILTSSNLSLEKLYTGLVNTTLIEHIQSSHLEIERAPLNSVMLRELLDLFFYKEERQDLH
jgi:hypothetical protein